MTHLGRLRLFHAESYRVEVSKPSVRTFLIKHTSAMRGFVTPAMLMGRSIDPDPFSDPPPGTQSTNTTFAPHATCLRCKMCRRVLASDEDVTQHAPGKGELSFEPHKRESVRKGLDQHLCPVNEARPQTVQPFRICLRRRGSVPCSEDCCIPLHVLPILSSRLNG